MCYVSFMLESFRVSKDNPISNLVDNFQWSILYTSQKSPSFLVGFEDKIILVEVEVKLEEIWGLKWDL